MQSHNTLLNIFIEPLNKAKIKYMVTGSVASICYGEPRMTHDVDLVFNLGDDDVAELETAFPNDKYYLPPLEVVRMEKARSTRGHFNIIHFETAFKADIYFTGADPLQLWGMSDRRKWEIDNIDFWLAPPEYVIVKKLHYWEEGGHCKHLDDILAMLKMQGNQIVSSEVLERLTSNCLKDKFNELLRLS
jgi:hypothetical protein